MPRKEIIRRAFEGTASGDGRDFLAMLAADVRWTILGTTSWSRTYEGKSAVIEELLRPLAAQFDGPNLVSLIRLIDAGDTIIAEGENQSITLAGARYPNRYCWIFTFDGDEVADIVEYCDTALIDRVLSSPVSRSA